MSSNYHRINNLRILDFEKDPKSHIHENLNTQKLPDPQYYNYVFIIFIHPKMGIVAEVQILNEDKNTMVLGG